MSDWIEIDQLWSKFKHSTLCRSGVVVVIRVNGQDNEVLIGDVNTYGCSDCSCGIWDGIVIRAKVVWSGEIGANKTNR